jgi:hypothetical protein
MNKAITLSTLLGAAAVSHAGIWNVNFVNDLMTGAEAVPPTASVALGGELGAGIRYNDAANRLEINLLYGMIGWPELEGNFLSASLGIGAPGQEGQQVADMTTWNLAFGSRRGFILGETTLTQAQEAQLFAGNFYINISSAKYPTGEIRGQLAVVPEPGTWALLLAGLGGLWYFRRK